jgi:hypothetical protein
MSSEIGGPGYDVNAGYTDREVAEILVTGNLPDAARPVESVEIATLLKIIRDAYLYAIPTHSIVGVPEAILASDWFARSLAQARAEGAQASLSEVTAHGVALDKGSGIVCLCGEVCNAVIGKSPASLMGTTSDYYEAVNAGTVFARHLHDVRARAAAQQATTRGQGEGVGR